MRAFRNVSKEVQDNLTLRYPALDNRTSESLEDWPCVAITVFDHWLTREEFEQHFTHRSLDQQMDIEQRWHSLYSFLAKDLACYQYKYRSTHRLMFKEPRNRAVFVRRLSRSSMAGALTLVIPEYSAVLEQGYDETCWLYFECRASIEPLLHKIRALGLYTLERI